MVCEFLSNKRFNAILLFFCVFSSLILSCSSEEGVGLCLSLPVKPKLESKTLTNAKFKEPYAAEVLYWVQNGDDNDYQLNKYSTQGDFPDGLKLFPEYINGSKIAIAGKCTKIGVYQFEIIIEMSKSIISIGDSTVASLCERTARMSYLIEVE